MNKKLVVSVAFVVIVAVVIISFSTYYATLLETQKLAQDRFLTSQQEPQQEFENGSPILGSESAPITIVEFGDYQCEACYAWFHNTRDTLIDNYIETGKAKLIFVD
ncbi:MAG: thioredoxin domain-containing protein, partial [Thermoproteota archaeon]|nr:thioredoxin domain-containing protein [Thermoproteota archaeon]